MKAVVMAGGFGTRIQPLTNSRPKPMLPVVNVPMMEHIMKDLVSLGIEDIVVLLYYKPEVIKNYFGNGERIGARITYVLPEADFGTAGAVKKAQKYLDETFIVVSGDVITDFDLREIVGFHEFKNSKLTITLTSVSNPLQFGIVIKDKDGKILKFLEKPSWGEVFSDTINTGIYVIEPEVLDYIPENVPFDFSKDLFPLLMEKGITLYGFESEGYWKDVGNPDAYREVNSDILNGNVKLQIPGKAVKYPEGILFLQGDVKVPESVRIKGTVVLGDGVELGDGTVLENCIVGERSRIGRRCKLKDTVIWEESTLGDDVSMRNCVVCDRVDVGSRVSALKGAIIAEKVKIEDDVRIEKDVVIWPEKFVESGSIVSSNLVWGEKWKRSIFEGGEISGRTNVELSPELAAKLGAALGTTLPEGSFVIMSRDYHRASRMIKRAFLSGLLSTGVNVIDMKKFPKPAMGYVLKNNGAISGIHFEASSSVPGHNDIIFLDEFGIRIDTAKEKAIERIFFREKFRKVGPSEVGIIKEELYGVEEYVKGIKERIDDKIKQPRFNIVVDLMNGIFSDVYPELLAHFKVNSIVLNSYESEEKLMQYPTVKSKSLRDVPKIVKSTSSDVGFIIHPGGERLAVVSDSGEVIGNHLLLLLFLKTIDDALDKRVKAYVPVSCPSVIDESLKKVNIERGKFRGISQRLLKEYFFIGDLEGKFIFPEFSFSPDAVYSSIKFLELLSFSGKRISEILSEIPEFFFTHVIINCPLSKKARLMRKLSEEALERRASFIDGVKIFFDGDWILFIPDQFTDKLHIFVQSVNEERGRELLESYRELVSNWIEGKE
ncbi:mannose-1-phosphate guanylyltransferase / phosphomannomutase [Balnearium lithotrophicum]|uniref:Mannose-1-phosphate guanylyltransferase / phosphomannomutase n=1 Tax=Balnearium lithotrophicum TaxID=223788 RepID=A0A521BNU7_9BACT|nr:sugar phosphate nucleotidyltransferase [Balnearium lithotrophicum]SMO48769.1 mannose-1-phosphate guanylyltransferase / phosphomannomutase [Balnearium lithotrophicum]